MTQMEFLEKWMNQLWRQSKKNARFVNITMKGLGYNVAVMPDRCDTDKWTFSIRIQGEKNSGEFSKRKFRTFEKAQLAALERAANLFELR